MRSLSVKLDHTQIHPLLETATVAARLAGQKALEEIRYTKTEIKNNNEIVTNTDRVCQDLIIRRIKENYPDHGFLAEEGPGGGIFKQSPRGADNLWWVIDPIDGTNNYSHGNLCFTVSIAVVYEGRPVVGVIFEPATESMYTAAYGMEAQLNYSHIQVNNEQINPFASFAVDSHFGPEHAQGIMDIMKRTRFRTLGSTALHLSYVARGSFIGCLAIETKLWDIAAGSLIIQSAGGKITDLNNQELLPINLENYTGQKFRLLASNAVCHDQLSEIFKV
jgi:myo-inositol-1(or 4)-monophosphatase